MPRGNPVKSTLFGCCTQEGRAACLTSGTNHSGTEQKASGRDRLVPLLVERVPSRPGKVGLRSRRGVRRSHFPQYVSACARHLHDGDHWRPPRRAIRCPNTTNGESGVKGFSARWRTKCPEGRGETQRPQWISALTFGGTPRVTWSVTPVSFNSISSQP